MKISLHNTYSPPHLAAVLKLADGHVLGEGDQLGEGVLVHSATVHSCSLSLRSQEEAREDEEEELK